MLIASSLDHKALIWKLKTMRVLHTLTGHKDNINACRLSYSKKSALTGSLDRTIKFWDLDKGICFKTNICMSQCFDLNMQLSETYVASAHFDGTIRIWSIKTGELAQEIKGAHDDIITSVKFTPDEKYVIIAPNQI